MPVAQPADEGLPGQHQGDLLPRHASTSTSPYPPWFAGLGAYGLLGHRPVRHPAARACSTPSTIEDEEPVIDTTHGARRHRVPRRLPHRQRRPVRVLLRALRHRGRGGGGELRRAGRRPSGDGDRWACRLRDTETGEELHRPRPGSSSTRPARSSTGSTPRWGSTTDHRIVYSKGIHLVVPRLTTTRPRPGARLLRRHPAAVLRHPDGQPVGDRHHRHPHRHARHPRQRRRPRLPARPDQRAARPARSRSPPTTSSPSAAACGRWWCKRERRRPDRRRLDLAQPQARDRARPRPRASSPIFGGKLTDCLNVGEEVAERVRVPRRAAREGPAQLVRRAGQGHPRRVLPPGPADEARRPAHQARHRAAVRPAVAALRPPGVRHARGDPRRPAHGRGHHGAAPTTCGSSCTSRPAPR